MATRRHQACHFGERATSALISIITTTTTISYYYYYYYYYHYYYYHCYGPSYES